MITIGVVLLLVVVAFFAFTTIESKGEHGEKKVSDVLGHLGSSYRVFNDVLIKTSYGTSQIDHIVVSPYGIFVIETKNYVGWIYGSENIDKWTQNVWGHKYEMYNPIKQNYGHVRTLKSVLPLFAKNQYVSIIVFLTSATLKIHVSEERNVIYIDRLLKTIRSYRESVLTAEQQQQYVDALQQYLVSTKDDRVSHVKEVKKNIRIRESKISQGICPDCGGTLEKRKGKYGYFYGCSNYPRCRFTTH